MAEKSKLEELCEELDAFCDSTADKAIALLHAYDHLAEFAGHAPRCLAGNEAMPIPCVCGLSAAQQAVADILERC